MQGFSSCARRAESKQEQTNEKRTLPNPNALIPTTASQQSPIGTPFHTLAFTLVPLEWIHRFPLAAVACLRRLTIIDARFVGLLPDTYGGIE